MLSPGHLTSAQAADHLGITIGTLRVLARRSEGFPRPQQIGRNLIWQQSDLDAWRADHPARRRTGTREPCTSEAFSPAQQPSADGAG